VEGDDAMKSILDPSFKYTNSASTDIRKTFARVRREQQKAKDVPPTKAVPVLSLLRKK